MRSNGCLVRLHPQELPVSQVPEACRWHIDSGVADPAGDGSGWCRLPHALLCPARAVPPTVSQLSGLRRSLATRTRRLLNARTLVPPAVPLDSPPAGETTCRPARPIVELLYARYLASHPVDEMQCVAQTRRRRRCPALVLSPDAPGGTWALTPVNATSGQLALPFDAMTVYSLSALQYQEQLRWRAQRCRQHAAALTAGDMAVADWEPFDPRRHHEHIHTRLPTHGRRPGRSGPALRRARP